MRIAKLNNKPSVVLCDRGLMDGSAYSKIYKFHIQFNG